jgi:hypothetical protein
VPIKTVRVYHARGWDVMTTVAESMVPEYVWTADNALAFTAMDDDDRFDHPDFKKRYELRLAQHDKERQEKAARRRRPIAPIDLFSCRKR